MLTLMPDSSTILWLQHLILCSIDLLGVGFPTVPWTLTWRQYWWSYSLFWKWSFCCRAFGEVLRCADFDARLLCHPSAAPYDTLQHWSTRRQLSNGALDVNLASILVELQPVLEVVFLLPGIWRGSEMCWLWCQIPLPSFGCSIRYFAVLIYLASAFQRCPGR